MNYKQLKIFAVCCMVFDHVTRIFPIHRMLLPLGERLWMGGHENLAEWVMEDLAFMLQFIGRLAAPVFLFCIAMGFCHTRNVERYLRRLLLTAVLAQVPYILFDLAESRLYGFTGDWRDVGLNILFTLALGLLALAVYERLFRQGRPALGLMAAAAAALLARLLHMEGKEGYILLIFVFYFTRSCPRWQRALWFLPAVLLSRWGLVQMTLEDPGFFSSCLLNVLGNYLGMLVTLCYTGEKGNTGKGFQRLMYLFYPAHFAVLALIGYLRPPF